MRVESTGPSALPGPYCPFTGRSLRPWWRKLAVLATFLLGLGAVVAGAAWVCALADPPLPVAVAVVVAAGLALFYLVALTGGWLRVAILAAVAVLAAAVAVLDPAIPALPETWPPDLRAAADRLREARPGGVAVAVLGGALVALACGGHALLLGWAAWRFRWPLERVWFSRFHPVFGTRYDPRDRAAGPVALLAIRDGLMRDKLVWLSVGPDAQGVRCGSGSEPAVPLPKLDEPIQIFLQGGRWLHWVPRPCDAAVLLPILSEPASHPSENVSWQPVDGLPVRDLFEGDNDTYAKTYSGEAPRLLGVLIRCRLTVPDCPGVPEAVVFVVDPAGQLRVEYPPCDIKVDARLSACSLRIDWGEASFEFDTSDPEPVAVIHAGREVLLFLPAPGENPA